MEAPARGALAKLSAVLPEGRRAARDAAALRGALREERRLAIAYEDGGAVASERVVWPVAIGVFERTQLLAAWCELRGDFRHFRLDRIRAARVLEGRMPRRRAALYREWRARERACLPAAPHERD